MNTTRKPRATPEAITLRDLFAAAALAGIAAHGKGPQVKDGDSIPKAHARWAWQTADEMMAMRKMKNC